MLENNRNPQTGSAIVPTFSIFQKVSVVLGLNLDELIRSLNDDQMIAVNESFPLTPDESQLLEDYRSLTPPGQEYIRQTMAMAVHSYSAGDDALSALEDAD